MKPAKILFFINGVMPTGEEIEAAAELAANVVFRNAKFVPDEPHSLEICDGVAGCVPKLYAEKFPTAKDAIKKKAAEIKALSEKVGDTKAPTVAKPSDGAKPANWAGNK